MKKIHGSVNSEQTPGQQQNEESNTVEEVD